MALTGALRKAFVSVKGIYFQARSRRSRVCRSSCSPDSRAAPATTAQASVCGETITWLVPHCLTQLLPSDVDYRVMLTFLEFDEVRTPPSSHPTIPPPPRLTHNPHRPSSGL